MKEKLGRSMISAFKKLSTGICGIFSSCLILTSSAHAYITVAKAQAGCYTYYYTREELIECTRSGWCPLLGGLPEALLSGRVIINGCSESKMGSPPPLPTSPQNRQGPSQAEIAARNAEIARQQEASRQAEAARQAEVARKAEQARLAEITRKAEEARLAELARQAEVRKQRAKINLIEVEYKAKEAQQEVDLAIETGEKEKIHEVESDKNWQDFEDKLKVKQEEQSADSKALLDAVSNLSDEQRATMKERAAKLREAKRLREEAAANHPSIPIDLDNHQPPRTAQELSFRDQERLARHNQETLFNALHPDAPGAHFRGDAPVEQSTLHEDVLLLGAGVAASAAKTALAAGAKALEREAVEIFCFPGETEVCVKGGHSKRIDQIKVGDYVEACDLASNRCERRKVLKVFKNTTDHLSVLSFANSDKKVRTTDNHPFYVVNKNKWVEARKLDPGDRFKTISGPEAVFKGNEIQSGQTTVYNIEVEQHHNYYACGVLVHNCNEAGTIGTGAAKVATTLQADVAAIVDKAIADQAENKAATTLSSAGQSGAGDLIIGKLKDVSKPVGWETGDHTLHLPNLGSVKQNWKQNSGRLREAINDGKSIRDTSIDLETGALRDNTGFLRAERNLLKNKGKTYNPISKHWE